MRVESCLGEVGFVSDSSPSMETRHHLEFTARLCGVDVDGEREVEDLWGDGGLDDQAWFEQFSRCGISETTIQLIDRSKKIGGEV